MNDFINLIKNKNFMLLWGSAVISQITINMLSFLILTRIFEITNSTIATSFVWVSYAIAAVLFGPFGAVIADISSRRKMLMVTNFLQAGIVLIYSFLYKQYFYLGYGIVFLYAAFNQFYVPAEAAALPAVVSKKLLPTANGLLFITVQSALVLGLVSAGFLYDFLGFGMALTITSLMLFGAFACVSFLPKLGTKEKIPTEFEKGVKKMMTELTEGYHFIRYNPDIFYPFILLIGLQVSLSVLVILMPVMAKEILMIRASLSSIIVVVPAALGALLGTITISKLISRHMRKKDIITIGLSLLSVSILICADIVPILPFWMGRTVAVISFFLAGISYVGTSIPTLTYLQEHTPGGLMGRVLGNIWFISAVATVLPVLFAATVAELFGVGTILTILAILGIIGVLVFRYHGKLTKMYAIIRKT